MTPFLSHVCHIFCVCAEKQVRWIDAWWVVAAMAHFKSIWNRTVGQFPRCAVRANLSRPVEWAHGRRGAGPAEAVMIDRKRRTVGLSVALRCATAKKVES